MICGGGEAYRLFRIANSLALAPQALAPVYYL